jgi:phage gpG-like protein
MSDLLPYQKKKALIPMIKKQALAKAAKMAQTHFLNSFKKEGFTDSTLKRWERRKQDTGRGILVGKQARLKRSLQIRRISRDSALIGTKGIKYAAIHNKGGVTHPRVTEKMRGFAWHKWKETKDPKWKAIALTDQSTLTVPIPKREFVGRSKVLEKATEKMLSKHFLKLFKP